MSLARSVAPAPDDPRLSAVRCIDLQPVVTEHVNPWFAVRNRGGRFTVEYSTPQVLVLPVVDKKSVMMVRVKRPVICDSPLELPAGAIEAGESVCAAAAHELSEETGVRIADERRFLPLPPISVSPNRNPCLFHVVRIDLSRDEFEARTGHDQEVAGVVLLTDEQIKITLMQGGVYVTTPAAIIACHFLLPLLVKV